MTLSFIEHTEVPSGGTEDLVGDNTIGLLRAGRGEEIRGDVVYDLHRLRRAILAFEEEFGDKLAEVALVENPEVECGSTLLALAPSGGSDRAVVIGQRHFEDPNEGPADVEQLVVGPEDGDSA